MGGRHLVFSPREYCNGVSDRVEPFSRAEATMRRMTHKQLTDLRAHRKAFPLVDAEHARHALAVAERLIAQQKPVKPKRPKPFFGFVYVDPNGHMGTHIHQDRNEARGDAAFSISRTNTIRMPDDWLIARKRGYRVIRVKVRLSKI